MWSLLYYVKADQEGWEQSYCVSQVLQPLLDSRSKLGGHIRDAWVQCKRHPAICYELKDDPELSQHWVEYATYWSGTRRFKVSAGPTLANLTTDEAATVDEDDAATSGAIARYLQWALEGLPLDEKTVLVFWGHGAAFMIPFLNSLRPMSDEMRGRFERFGIAAPRLALQGEKTIAISPPMDTSRYHGLPAFAQGLSRGLATHRGKCSVLAFNSCFMASIEVAYEFMDLAEVMVASEESTPFEQWKHAEWISRLHGKPAASAEDVALMMVETYRAKTKADATISAIRLGPGIDAIRKAIKAFVDVAAANVGDVAVWRAMQEARVATGHYGRYGGPLDVITVDILRWFGQVREKCGGPVAAAAAEVEKACGTKVIFARDAAPAREGRYGSHGLSIFFPASRLEFGRLALRDRYSPGAKDAPKFVNDSGWRAFLDAYWRFIEG